MKSIAKITNGTKQIVLGSTGTKYTVSKNKKGGMECSCPRWINTSPRKDCKHILSVLTGKPIQKETKVKAKKVVVKAVVVPTEKLNVKQASEKIFKLIASQPGKLTRRILVKKANLKPTTIAAACEALWAAKRISKGRCKEGWLSGGYIPRKKVA